MRWRSRSKPRRRPRWRAYVDAALAALVLAGVAFVAAQLERHAGEDISGRMRVIDGDSLAFGERRLRLKGIDAPELLQVCRRGSSAYACGRDAAAHLRSLVEGRIDCRSEGSDRYRRTLVRCRSGAVDINMAMVRSGHAVAYGDYEMNEAEARAEGLGVWAGDFVRPGDWRAEHAQAEPWFFTDLVFEQLGAPWLALRRWAGWPARPEAGRDL